MSAALLAMPLFKVVSAAFTLWALDVRRFLPPSPRFRPVFDRFKFDVLNAAL